MLNYTGWVVGIPRSWIIKNQKNILASFSAPNHQPTGVSRSLCSIVVTFPIGSSKSPKLRLVKIPIGSSTSPLVRQPSPKAQHPPGEMPGPGLEESVPRTGTWRSGSRRIQRVQGEKLGFLRMVSPLLEIQKRIAPEIPGENGCAIAAILMSLLAKAGTLWLIDILVGTSHTHKTCWKTENPGVAALQKEKQWPCFVEHPCVYNCTCIK